MKCRAFFVEDITVVTRICDAAPDAQIARQVSPDGALPAEDARTKSESYHAFALVALLDLAWLCRTASPASPDLFVYQTRTGRSLRRAVEWMAPYANGSRHWDAGPQVRPFDPTVFTKIYRTAAIGFPENWQRFAAIARRPPGAAASAQQLLRPYPERNS